MLEGELAVFVCEGRGEEREADAVWAVNTGGSGDRLGVGAGVGAIAGHAQEKPNDFFPGLSTEAYAAIGGAAGLVAGGVIGRVTDFARGPTVYLRP